MSTINQNYVPKADSTNPSLANFDQSQIYDNGTNVGIGTASPSKNLHVYKGAGNVNSLIESSASEAQLDLKSGANYTRLFYRDSDDEFGIYHKGTTRLRIESDGTMLLNETGGNVGIGTTSPSGKLHLEKSGTNTDPVLNVQHTSDINVATPIVPANITTSNQLRTVLTSNHRNFHQNLLVQVEDFAPGYGDHIGISSKMWSARDRVAGGSSGGDLWAFYGVVSNEAGGNVRRTNGIAMELCPINQYDNYLDTDLLGNPPEDLMYGLAIYPDGATKHITRGIELVPGGAAGTQIGYSTGLMLSGFVDSAITLDSYITNRKPGSGTETPDRVGLRFLENMENLIFIQRAGNKAWRLFAPNNSDYLSFQYDIDGKILAISTIPNAGGSNYAVDDILSVSGGTGGQVKVLEVENGAVKRVKLENTGTGGYTGGMKTTSAVSGSGSGCEIIINGILSPANAKDLLVLKNDGNVGIGTTGPSKKLHVYGGDAAVENNLNGEVNLRIRNANATSGGSGIIALEFDSNDGANSRIIQSNDLMEIGYSDHFQIRKRNAGIPNLYIDNGGSTGNVGIGTTSPAKKLHVSSGDMGVDAGYKVYLDLSEGTKDTYITYESSYVRIYKNGTKVAEW